MTPLAHRLAKRVLDVKTRSQKERESLRGALCDAHFFEVSKIMPLVEDLLEKWEAIPSQILPFEKFDFLPAPKTWLEFKDVNQRWAFVLSDGPQNSVQYRVLVLADDDDGDWTSDPNAIKISRYYRGDDLGDWIRRLLTVLVILINTPRIIGRRQHMPHRGLERELLRNQKLIGKFPLHAWTEIKLEVSKPPEIDFGPIHEVRLTGQKCLHFCRAHLRIWNGELIFVSAHWRGNPAIGIKQSRYACV